ncbi:hypothetical protein HYFRA_00001350 [Hymenoscyphus fraxineus]|uniref:Zn(2)-C6 fungal-type domain-containing protein n=1 Tax=Hymenoscyphus fraxineus TaxID=746836 RepID=A0A9N9PZ82_9HELO|nr:hypothetical protein HYFRA_00001350 [Hymenoscyphus fraxineus]
MNQLSDQVTDLDYLVNSPLPAPIANQGQSPSQSQSHSQSQSQGRVNSPLPTNSYSSSSIMTQQRQHSSSVDSPGDEGHGIKRKIDQQVGNAPTGHTRAKRNRYISIACNECKRRKIKCNGNTPCQRCGNLNLECQYAPNCCTNGFKESEEFRQMNAQIASLQEQVDNLYAGLNALKSNRDNAYILPQPVDTPMSLPLPPPPVSPALSQRHRPIARQPTYQGPTSSAFSLNVAKNTLQNMGYQGLTVDEAPPTHDITPTASPRRLSVQPSPRPEGAHPVKEPLWQITKAEMIRLCRVYEEEMGIMYPIVDIERVIIHGTNVYDFVDSVYRNGLRNTTSEGQGPIRDEQTFVLKMVLACSFLTEGHGQSEIADSLYESVREAADAIYHGEVGVKDLPFLVLVVSAIFPRSVHRHAPVLSRYIIFETMYHFHSDQEALAWRMIGQVARICIELGLHRRESLFKAVLDEHERSQAINMFWSIYVLDRRWSFGTGLPFALQDADIDPNLPEPELSIPYLNVMIGYSRIGSKVWRSICSFKSTPLNIEEIEFLDYQILQWQKNIPQTLQLPTAAAPQTNSRTIHRLQILLYIRANQMRILIYRPVLHSASSIQENLNHASTVVELAKDTIRALSHLNQTTDIYRAQQVCFNYFLTSAIAVLFLASCHAPVHFSALCREEFYMALDLVKGFSNKSWVSKRLWKTIKGLKEVGPKLGLDEVQHNNSRDEDHESAALAMAGLAGHEIGNLGGNGYQGGVNGVGVNGQHAKSSPDGYQMSHDMTTLFEAALGSVNGNAGNGNTGNVPGNGVSAPGGGVGGVGYVLNEVPGDQGMQVPQQHGGGGGVSQHPGNLNGIASSVFGGDEELYRQLRDLF